MTGQPDPVDDYSIDAADIVDQLAQDVRDLYIEERRQWESDRTGRPNYYMSGLQWDGSAGDDECRPKKAFWPTLARFILRHGLDPETYIRGVFRFGGLGSAAPLPSQFAHERTLNIFRRLPMGRTDVEAVRAAFQSQQTTLACETAAMDKPERTIDEVRRMVLIASYLPLSPLFRYCCAVEVGMTDIAEHYFLAALKQYMRLPLRYDEVWGNAIPNTLRQRVRSLRGQVMTERRDGEASYE